MAGEACRDHLAVSVVLPAHNEAEGIGVTVREYVEALSELGTLKGLDWEVIVVDDGSTDGTGAELEALSGASSLRVVRHAESRGYGAAIKSGVLAALHPWILIADADGTYPARHIGEILDECGQGLMVVGARRRGASGTAVVRRPAKWMLTRLATWLSGTRIEDLNSGMRAFPKDLVTACRRILPDGFSFTSTITIAALASGWSVRYIPIDYRRREGRSKIRPVRDTLGFLSLILRTVIFFDPLRVILPLSLLLIGAAVAVGLGSYFVTGQLMDVTTVVLLVSGVQLLVLGMVADSINRWLS